MTRRKLLLWMLALSASTAVRPALASDDDDSGDDDSGSDDSGSDDDSSGSNSGSGSSGSGSGSGSNSGSGSDDDDDDDAGDDDSGGKDGSGSGSGKGSGKGSGHGDDDDVDARDAVRAGLAMPLREAMEKLRKQKSGRIIDAELTTKGKRLVYVFTLVGDGGTVSKVTMDAKTGRLPGLFGF